MIHDDDINCQHNHIKDKNIYKENSYLMPEKMGIVIHVE